MVLIVSCCEGGSICDASANIDGLWEIDDCKDTVGVGVFKSKIDEDGVDDSRLESINVTGDGEVVMVADPDGFCLVPERDIEATDLGELEKRNENEREGVGDMDMLGKSNIVGEEIIVRLGDDELFSVAETVIIESPKELDNLGVYVGDFDRMNDIEGVVSDDPDGLKPLSTFILGEEST